MKLIRARNIILAALLIAAPMLARPQTDSTADRLSLANLFTYQSKQLGPLRWEAAGGGYLKLEPAEAGKPPVDIVRYDSATGTRTVLLPAQKLTPPGAASPLVI